MIVFGQPALVLAPMEGVTDAPMRALLTERGGFDFCVAEFFRVGPNPYSDRVFYEHVPELRHGCRTPAGIPIQVQLLGGDSDQMAQVAVRAVELGASAIDINFGCPSKTVNRHDGGAAILQHPDRVRSITQSVRSALDPSIPVSVKMRLGWEKMEDIYHNAEQAALGGASWLTIHARTKRQGYAPPAYWKYIGEVRERLDIPVVANGEIWTIEDFLRCREMTGCEHFMIGRGALADPLLPLKIKRYLVPFPNAAQELGSREIALSDEIANLAEFDWLPLLTRFVELNLPFAKKGPEVIVGRLKQWLKMAHQRQAIPWFEDVKRAETIEDILKVPGSFLKCAAFQKGTGYLNSLASAEPREV